MDSKPIMTLLLGLALGGAIGWELGRQRADPATSTGGAAAGATASAGPLALAQTVPSGAPAEGAELPTQPTAPPTPRFDRTAPLNVASEAPVERPLPPPLLDPPEPTLDNPVTPTEALPEFARSLPEAIRIRLPNNVFALSGTPMRGDLANAKVVVIAFTDFECPFSKKMAALLREVERTAGSDVLFAHRNLPLSIHSNAVGAAKAAMAAKKQKKFWEFHDKLFERQEELGDPLYRQIAGELGLDVAQWEADRTSEAVEAWVKVDTLIAQGYWIDATPTLLVNGKKVIGYVGADTIEIFIRAMRERVDAELAKGSSVITARADVSLSNVEAERDSRDKAMGIDAGP